MDMHDTILIRELTESFTTQLTWYRDLCDIAQQLLSHIVISRGDLSGFRDGLQKKQALLKNIESERQRIGPYVSQWQAVKEQMPSDETIAQLNLVLVQTESVIGEFLSIEEQLQKCLAHAVHG